MELNEHDTVRIFDSHHGIGQTFGGKGFSYTRSALQDQVLLGFQNGGHAVIILLREVDLGQKISLRVGGTRDGYRRNNFIGVLFVLSSGIFK